MIAITFIIVLFAVLAHELGHAFVARLYGAKPTVVLHGFGGTTSLHGVRLGRGRNIITTLAGPGAGFLLGGAVFLATRWGLAGASGPLTARIVRQVLYCTFGWGILNLLPVLPLDGGLILRDALGPRGGRIAYAVSALCGSALCGWCLVHRIFIGALFFGVATWHSLRAAWSYQERRDAELARTQIITEELDTIAALLDRDQLDETERRAVAALKVAPQADQRDRARRLLVSVVLHREQGLRAFSLLETLENPSISDDVLRAHALELVGERDAAFELLERRTAEHPGGPTLDPLLCGLFAVGNIDRALALAQQHQDKGNPAALATLATSFFTTGRYGQAAQLFVALYERTGEAAYAYEVARSQAHVGDRDAALSFLETAFRHGFPLDHLDAHQADFASLHQDPRFARLIADVHAPS